MDVLGQAQTGTGKTAAFALPGSRAKLDTQARLPQVLVLTPTRELAIQVAEAFQRYAAHLPGFPRRCRFTAALTIADSFGSCSAVCRWLWVRRGG
jgi:superfamily II DNA/RNA helicase